MHTCVPVCLKWHKYTMPHTFTLYCIHSLYILTCKHSDVRALPQQRSPDSWRSKQANICCSSLWRQALINSPVVEDVAQALLQRGERPKPQQRRPDHWDPRATAFYDIDIHKHIRQRANRKSIEMLYIKKRKRWVCMSYMTEPRVSYTLNCE